MSASAEYLNPSKAARRLGVSPKALRLYEKRGLIVPRRTAAGWRVYGPDEMARAGEVVALRALGLSLAQVARTLAGDAAELEPALAAHQASLEHRIRELARTAERVRGLRSELLQGQAPAADALVELTRREGETTVAFDLPWPWGGERFELRGVRPITFITGPLGCGKTRLAQRIAEISPGAAFLGLDRAAGGVEAVRALMASDAALKARVEAHLTWLAEDGATVSDALVALLCGLEDEVPAVFVVDMVEQGLDEATQQALIAGLRRRGPGARPLFLMTRSSAILDLDAVGPDEAILYCPANHAPPFLVAPYPGAPGYEAVADCLAAPDVRARTEGMQAVMAG
ncbi:MerR family transcriptional regulator [Phenylobacterium montanum]|uniref:MerR family transcriptional regulator n=1 Tax=Phenylobacterium montanum TaxID=2823693 RepID=A0A975FZ26_9CAUL|nr:MerR family transcriptional regulator [Caulobacter sp. S6]QUD87609.1 MerR family transcriptional regulator [Caulobacter sp. S6]